MKFKIWYADLVQSTDDIAHVVNGKHIKYFSEIIRIIEYLHSLNCQSIDVKDESKDCVEKFVRLMDSVDELVRPKLKFIIEQIQLAFMHVKLRPLK